MLTDNVKEAGLEPGGVEVMRVSVIQLARDWKDCEQNIIYQNDKS